MFKEKELGYKELGLLILVAYAFSFMVRMIWVWQFQDNPNFFWNDQLMINTNDGYFFASAVEYLVNGAHGDNPRVHIAIDSYPGMVYTTYLLTKYTPFSIETVILYLPAVISSFVVIPLVLTGKLIKLPWVGFFSALLGSIVWSYYNRTMIGYYDTDMFSVLLQFTVLYFFLLTIYVKEDKNVLWLAFTLLIYPYFYPQGLSLIYAIFILWTLYQLVFQREERNSYLFIVVASIALWAVPIWVKVVLIILAFAFLEQIKSKIDNKKFFYLTLLALLVFFFFGNVFSLIWGKVSIYLNRGVEESGLHFYQVIQTVREAGSISWETVSNRIIGHPILLVLGIFGYISLVIKHKPYILALPLIGVGVFAHWAGLRFTVYAVPVAAFSVIYLFYIVSQYIENKKIAYGVFIVSSILALQPNIKHIIGYKVPTVLNTQEVKDLDDLNQIANSKDYTLSWWDYGYPIWYYSDTITLIDGAKHHNDNFIISKIMQTSSPELAANLSRLAVETYVDSNYSTITNILFKNKQKDQLDPNLLLSELEDSNYTLPKKTRDIYLYLPYRMLNIFPTVAVFGNLDLTTGQEERKIAFYPTQAASNKNGMVTFSNGIVFDTAKGLIRLGQQEKAVKHFIVTQNTKEGKVQLQSQLYHADGDYTIVYMRSYGRFVVMDSETFNSTYVQMFMLEKYDKNLFELVVSSPYSKIYKLKK
ncbi:peptide-binding protein [Sulfurovum sp. XGS-02]|uniref:STT3 domain-containing protein n=1 Tax=Sulfurovum sp. XGS-02 TaxID=2925411 RepID=UPI002047D354|nr:STT3 domain-containing protein [Sulfurovum sp. XGS-02]UPT77645.1 peptide-binding protein [Sulfurovum sp. XGS-02]